MTDTKNKIHSVSRKRPGQINLIMPLFFSHEALELMNDTGVADVSLNHILSGGCIYGDVSKKLALQSAQQFAPKKKVSIRVMRVIVNLEGAMPGRNRFTITDIATGDYGILRIDEKNSVSRDLTDEIDFKIIALAKERYPHHHHRDAKAWLELDPTLGSALFGDYPVNVIVVKSRLPYVEKPLSVALIRKDRWKDLINADIMYFADKSVNIIDD